MFLVLYLGSGGARIWAKEQGKMEIGVNESLRHLQSSDTVTYDSISSTQFVLKNCTSQLPKIT